MKLEDQVSNKELSEQLRDIGVPQDSLWYWKRTPKGEYYIQAGKITYNNCIIIASAFTVAELGEKLPHKIKPNDCLLGLWVNKFQGPRCWGVGYGSIIQYSETTEANARTKMLIHLIKEGAVKP